MHVERHNIKMFRVFEFDTWELGNTSNNTKRLSVFNHILWNLCELHAMTLYASRCSASGYIAGEEEGQQWKMTKSNQERRNQRKIATKMFSNKRSGDLSELSFRFFQNKILSLQQGYITRTHKSAWSQKVGLLNSGGGGSWFNTGAILGFLLIDLFQTKQSHPLLFIPFHQIYRAYCTPESIWWPWESFMFVCLFSFC